MPSNFCFHPSWIKFIQKLFKERANKTYEKNREESIYIIEKEKIRSQGHTLTLSCITNATVGKQKFSSKLHKCYAVVAKDPSEKSMGCSVLKLIIRLWLCFFYVMVRISLLCISKQQPGESQAALFFSGLPGLVAGLRDWFLNPVTSFQLWVGEEVPLIN